MQGGLSREVAGGLDRLDLDGLRVDRGLVGESQRDLLGGDATEQLAGLGNLGSDLDGSASYINHSLRIAKPSQLMTAHGYRRSEERRVGKEC